MHTSTEILKWDGLHWSKIMKTPMNGNLFLNEYVDAIWMMLTFIDSQNKLYLLLLGTTALSLV